MVAAAKISIPECLPGLLTRAEVARAFRLSTKAIQRMEAAGRLRAIRLGRNVRYRLADVKAALGV